MLKDVERNVKKEKQKQLQEKWITLRWVSKVIDESQDEWDRLTRESLEDEKKEREIWAKKSRLKKIEEIRKRNLQKKDGIQENLQSADPPTTPKITYKNVQLEEPIPTPSPSNKSQEIYTKTVLSIATPNPTHAVSPIQTARELAMEIVEEIYNKAVVPTTPQLSNPKAKTLDQEIATLPPIYPKTRNPVFHPPHVLTGDHHLGGFDDAEHHHNIPDGGAVGKPTGNACSPVPHPPAEVTGDHHLGGLDDDEPHHNTPDGGVVGKLSRNACSPVPHPAHGLTGDHPLGGLEDDDPHHNIPHGGVVGKQPIHACSPVSHPPHEQTGDHHHGGHDDDTHHHNIPDDRVVDKTTKYACSSAIIIGKQLPVKKWKEFCKINGNYKLTEVWEYGIQTSTRMRPGCQKSRRKENIHTELGPGKRSALTRSITPIKIKKKFINKSTPKKITKISAER